MEITAAMLADGATVADGKLYVHGGAWTDLNALQFPVTHPLLAVALIAKFEWTESHKPIDFDLELLDDELNQPLGVGAAGRLQVGHPPNLKPGSPVFQPIALQFPLVQFPKAGAYRFRIMLDKKEVASLPFRVHQQQIPQIPGTPQPTDF